MTMSDNMLLLDGIRSNGMTLSILEFLDSHLDHGQVENFQPYYRWNPRHMEELKVGAEMLEEALLVIQRKEEQANVSKLSQKEVQAQIAEKVGTNMCLINRETQRSNSGAPSLH